MDCQNGLKDNQIAVIMVPFPAQGHLNQLLHLSHLLTSYSIPVHYTGSATHNRQAKLRIQGWSLETSTKIHFHDLEFPHFSSPPPNPTINTPTLFPTHLLPAFEASIHLRQPVSNLIHKLAPKFKRIVVIHDTLMGSVVQDVKFISNAEAYNFLPASAFYMFFSIWERLPEKPFELDSDIPTSIVPSMEGCLTPEFEKLADYQRKYMDFQSGRLYNSSRVIEGKYVQLLERSSPNPDVKSFAIGPFNPVEVKMRSNNEKRHVCLEWLDKQELNSVIYVSFGSTTTISNEQIRELADGLERSEHKFIWVLRNADKGDIFGDNGAENIELPKGYEDRVKNRGIVVKDWAPQLEILAHRSTGGFMSHCGWNSSLESISLGVPVVAWPMHSDQPRNSILVTKVLGMGTMVREWNGRSELVMSSVIENAVKILMASKEGTVMRKRAVELSEAVRGAVAKGGVSYLEREAFIAYITR